MRTFSFTSSRRRRDTPSSASRSTEPSQAPCKPVRLQRVGAIAQAPYDAEAILSNPSAFKAEEIRTLRDQITSNLARAWEITGGSGDELTGVMVQIGQGWAKQLSDRK